MTRKELKDKLRKAFEERLEVHVRIRGEHNVWRGRVQNFFNDSFVLKLYNPTPAQDVLKASYNVIATLRVPEWEKVE